MLFEMIDLMVSIELKLENMFAIPHATRLAMMIVTLMMKGVPTNADNVECDVMKTD